MEENPGKEVVSVLRISRRLAENPADYIDSPELIRKRLLEMSAKG